MDELIPTFPRQVAIPHRILCYEKDDFYSYINRVNGVIKKIYFSILSCSKDNSFTDTKIDKIFFDLDSPTSLINARKLSEYCNKNNYRHTVIFSTGGFWVYIRTKNYENLINPKHALKQSQLAVANELNMTVGNEKECDIDHHIIGDICRVGRMPGTYDINRKLYCISLSKEEIQLTKEEIKKLAIKQRNKIFWYGQDALDISIHDSKFTPDEYIEMPEYEYNYQNSDNLSNFFPPCIIDILNDVESKGNWRGRWLVTLFMKEKGFPYKLTKDIARKYFSKRPRTDSLGNNYNHWLKVKCLDLVYNNPELIFPSCETLFTEGFCKGKCKFYNSLYK